MAPPIKRIKPHYKGWWDRLSPEEQNTYANESNSAYLFEGEGSPDKRTSDADSTIVSPAKKKQRTEGTSQESSGEQLSVDQDVEMGLPGTAQGAGGSGDGNASGAMEVYTPEKPLSIFGKKLSTYRKVHRFMTFGIAPTWINIDLKTPTESQRWLTTGLAKIPWEMPVLYLNPSEYNLLPEGSYCTEVRVQIVHRGNRIAFETGEVATRLATLNQIQNIMVAFGLNKTGWGTDVKYVSFDAANAMKPSAISPPIETEYDENFYGVENTNTKFTQYIPTHQIGIPYPLPNYYSLANAVENFGGVPPLTEHVTFHDGKTTINQVVAEFTYNPKFGQLKKPLKYIRSGLPRLGLTIPINGIKTDTTNATVTAVSSASSGGTSIIGQVDIDPSNADSKMNKLFSMTDLLEKSQVLKQGPWGQYQSPQVQPSIHVGVQAIPALTSTGILAPISDWTDAQADWDVFCEMDVVEHLPTKLPYATAANVPAGSVIYNTTDAIPDHNTCTYAGLYPTEPIRKTK